MSLVSESAEVVEAPAAQASSNPVIVAEPFTKDAVIQGVVERTILVGRESPVGRSRWWKFVEVIRELDRDSGEEGPASSSVFFSHRVSHLFFFAACLTFSHLFFSLRLTACLFLFSQRVSPFLTFFFAACLTFLFVS
jgi:hypothetical protein